jgi:hypothetical protein
MATAPYENTAPSVEEVYQTASNTSNLKVEADKRGSGDVMIAAGWSPSRVGMALLRLHSEWDSAAKPTRQSAEQIHALAITMPITSGKDKGKPDRQRAQAEADRWFVSELRLLAQSLKSRPVVWEQLNHWMVLKAIDPETVAAALLHWLDPTCGVCDGHGLRKVPNAPALSARQCHKCHGTGHIPHPHGSAKVLGYIDDCVQKARTSLKQRLHQRE